MKKKVNIILDELKLKAVQEYLSTDISQESLKKKYGFSGNGCIGNWMVKFGLSKPAEEQLFGPWGTVLLPAVCENTE